MNLTEAVDRVRPSIVQVVFHASGFSNDLRTQLGHPFISQPLGTGFIVSDSGYVITANHVIRDGSSTVESSPVGTKQLLIGFAHPNTENMRGNFTTVQFQIIDQDELHDLALLKLNVNPFGGQVKSGIVINGKEIPLAFGVAKLNTVRPKDGDAVAISGYPLGQSVLVTNAGVMATSWAFDLKETPVPGAPEWFRMPSVADTYLADVEVNPGNSGGPVYLAEDGSVIGVCVGSLGSQVWSEQCRHKLYYSSGLTMVVPTRYVVALLNKHGLSWSK